MQPGCLGVVALGPWLCVPGFRPVCPQPKLTMQAPPPTT